MQTALAAVRGFRRLSSCQPNSFIKDDRIQ